MGPLQGTRAVEVSLGVSAVGAGLAISLPGSLMRDFGAEVVRVQSARRSTLDHGVEFARAWDRGKEVVDVDDDDPQRAAETVAAHARDADVVFLAGPEELIERAGLQYRRLARSNPRLIVVRIRPSYNALGGMPDTELLVQARAGVPTQIRAHRAGPAFGDLAVGSAGAGLSATVGGLAGLYERESTGAGGWAETSLYDGIQAILPEDGGRGGGAGRSPHRAGRARERGPLSDVRALALSAYLAGPVGPLILAELGADVVKVEPLAGDVHRHMEPMFAAGQRGKRALALDLKSADAPAVLSRLFGWADLVHHNYRVGLAERLGDDEATVRAVNPDVVYSFASAFGERRPRALLPANDQLMQALAGIEAAQGRVGQPPTFLGSG